MRPHKYFVGKPQAVKTYGEREVCQGNKAGKAEYLGRTVELWERQDGKCALCGNWIELRYAEMDHQDGRGSGGGIRDDRTVVNGEWHNAAVHGICNTIKGSKRYSWVNGKYVAFVKQREVA